MFCKFCGVENNEGAKFCRGCGKPIVPPEEMNNPSFSTEETTEEVHETPVSEPEPVPEESFASTAPETPVETVEEPSQEIPVQPAPEPVASAAGAAPGYSDGQQAYQQPYQGGQPYPGTQGQPYPGNQGQPYQGGQPYPGTQPKPKYSGSSIACMVLGIVSAVFCGTVIVGIGCGIAALIVFGLARGKGERNGMLTAGLVTGIVGLVLSVIVLACIIFAGSIYGFANLWRSDDLRDIWDTGSSLWS